MKVRLHLPIPMIQPIARLHLLYKQIRGCSIQAIGFSTFLSPHISGSMLQIKDVDQVHQIVYKMIPLWICENFAFGCNLKGLGFCESTGSQIP